MVPEAADLLGAQDLAAVAQQLGSRLVVDRVLKKRERLANFYFLRFKKKWERFTTIGGDSVAR